MKIVNTGKFATKRDSLVCLIDASEFKITREEEGKLPKPRLKAGAGVKK
jgi:hypothetical protein